MVSVIKENLSTTDVAVNDKYYITNKIIDVKK